MKATLWGTRGSLPTPGPETVGYGGNTACVEVRGGDGAVIILDAGTGIRRLGYTLMDAEGRIDVMLSHLHVDHIQGLGFFAPLFQRGREIHIWGPASTTLDLRSRLARYLSPPLFPVPLRDLPCLLSLHDTPLGEPFEVGGLEIRAQLICHPGFSVGYRISEGPVSLTYIPDHEPALGARDFPGRPDWLSGYRLSEGSHLLIHDAQYTDEEYPAHIGWGHSTLNQALAFARACDVQRFVSFHHDPSHSDGMLDRLTAEVREQEWPFEFLPGWEGATFEFRD
jgi:phosphoribosyl 1,2-cyclic phosphodiesterase